MQIKPSVGKSVVDAMTSGSISVTSGFDVLRSLQAQAKLEEMTIIEERLSAWKRRTYEHTKQA